MIFIKLLSTWGVICYDDNIIPYFFSCCFVYLFAVSPSIPTH